MKYIAEAHEARLSFNIDNPMPRIFSFFLQAVALDVARWLQAQAEVKWVLYPALKGDPGYHLWKRDFTGASNLFGVLLHTENVFGASHLFKR